MEKAAERAENAKKLSDKIGEKMDKMSKPSKDEPELDMDDDDDDSKSRKKRAVEATDSQKTELGKINDIVKGMGNNLKSAKGQAKKLKENRKKLEARFKGIDEKAEGLIDRIKKGAADLAEKASSAIDKLKGLASKASSKASQAKEFFGGSDDKDGERKKRDTSQLDTEVNKMPEAKRDKMKELLKGKGSQDDLVEYMMDYPDVAKELLKDSESDKLEMIKEAGLSNRDEIQGLMEDAENKFPCGREFSKAQNGLRRMKGEINDVRQSFKAEKDSIKELKGKRDKALEAVKEKKEKAQEEAEELKKKAEEEKKKAEEAAKRTKRAAGTSIEATADDVDQESTDMDTEMTASSSAVDEMDLTLSAALTEAGIEATSDDNSSAKVATAAAGLAMLAVTVAMMV